MFKKKPYYILDILLGMIRELSNIIKPSNGIMDLIKILNNLLNELDNNGKLKFQNVNNFHKVMIDNSKELQTLSKRKYPNVFKFIKIGPLVYFDLEWDKAFYNK